MDARLILTVIALFGIGGALMALAGRNAGTRPDWTKYVVYEGVILGLLRRSFILAYFSSSVACSFERSHVI